MPVGRIVGAIGRAMVTAGLLLLLFVAYQLYGTGFAEARAQTELRDEFESALVTDPSRTPTGADAAERDEPGGDRPGTSTSVPARSGTATSAPATAPPRTPDGEAVAIIRIPAVGIDKAVVEGVGVEDLQKAPGHYPSTPLPGEVGNAAIAGHRTTYGAPFGDLGEVEEGDEIFVTTRQGEFRFLVDQISIVSPSQVEVLDPSEGARITLTTCHPRFSARQRLVVSGALAGAPIPAPATTVPTEEPTAPDPSQDPAEGEDPDDSDDPVVARPAPDVQDASLSGDPSARLPAAAWAGATALVALGARFLGGRWRRWPTYLLALPLGAVTLFLCFEKIALLLPPSL